MNKIKIILALIAAQFIFQASVSAAEEIERPYVIVLSMDAFRWDYPDLYETPNLDLIAKYGVKAKSVIPCFPTKTFPNHYSMATGLYPDNHGIVQNSFYDYDLKLNYSIGNRKAVKNPDFYNGEPIWVTAEKQGVTAASFYWVGSETAIENTQPTYWKDYNHNFPFEQRMDTVIAWLNLPKEKRPHLIMWYLHEPDDVGHGHGFDADITSYTVSGLDAYIGVFIDRISKLPIANKINLIFTSDHGMSNISPERNIVLKNYIPESWIEQINGYNPVYILDIKKNLEDSAFARLKRIPHIKVWKHGELPERLHYGSNPRTKDFIIVADSSWSVNWDKRNFKKKGTHGYDNINSDMHAIFYAVGPAFKSNHKHPSFNNIDLYSLIAHLLKLKPAKTDGKFSNVEDMLKE